MASWIELCENTSKKLDRELKEQEIAFLKWVYEKHVLDVNAKMTGTFQKDLTR